MTLKTKAVQLGTNNVTPSKNIVIANDTVSGDVVLSKGNHDGALIAIARIPNTGFVNYADDAAAALGGVAIGSFYRTASIIKIRVA